MELSVMKWGRARQRHRHKETGRGDSNRERQRKADRGPVIFQASGPLANIET